MKKKVVYQDGDYTKVIRGDVRETNDFVIVTNLEDKVTKIGNRFVISITEEN